jgi:hypothetical protein
VSQPFDNVPVAASPRSKGRREHAGGPSQDVLDVEETESAHLQEVWQADICAEGLDGRPCGPPSLLVEASRCDAAHAVEVRAEDPGTSDLGHIVLLLLAGTLSGLRDRLALDGFRREADLVGDLVEITDLWLTNEVPPPEHWG